MVQKLVNGQTASQTPDKHARRLPFVLICSAVLVVGALLLFGRPILESIGGLLGARIKEKLRQNESLPAVMVENGSTVYCRMSACDFRFPLPADARVKSVDPVSGVFDTIHGILYVTNASGNPVDLTAYAEVLKKHGFHVQGGFTSEVENAVGLLPSVTNHSGSYTIPWTASSPDGGCVAVDVVSNCTKIGFSYFGDL